MLAFEKANRILMCLCMRYLCSLGPIWIKLQISLVRSRKWMVECPVISILSMPWWRIIECPRQIETLCLHQDTIAFWQLPELQEKMQKWAEYRLSLWETFEKCCVLYFVGNPRHVRPTALSHVLAIPHSRLFIREQTSKCCEQRACCY